MRRMVCLITVLMMCMSLALPVYAAENSFVPSITYKPNPEIKTVKNEAGEEYIGIIRNANGEIIDYVGHSCIQITPVAHIWDEEIEVPEEIDQLLSFIYQELSLNNMVIPYEDHEAGLDPANMVIRDLLDLRWACEEHREMVAEEGVVLELTFDLGVVADAQIFAMTYDEETGKWSPIVEAVNNGDGTVTCIFERLGAVEFSMPIAAATVAVDEAPSANVLPWIIVLVCAVVAAVVVVIVIAKKKKSAV